MGIADADRHPRSFSDTQSTSDIWNGAGSRPSNRRRMGDGAAPVLGHSDGRGGGSNGRRGGMGIGLLGDCASADSTAMASRPIRDLVADHIPDRGCDLVANHGRSLLFSGDANRTL
jgi:hypothetical protein